MKNSFQQIKKYIDLTVPSKKLQNWKTFFFLIWILYWKGLCYFMKFIKIFLPLVKKFPLGQALS